jgi:hypothetical protein
LNVPEKYRPGLKLEIDFNMSVTDLCKKFTEHEIVDDASVPAGEIPFENRCSVFGLLPKEPIVFSRLNKYEDGYYILPPLDSASKVGDAIVGQEGEVRSSGGQATDLLLAWNGKTIHDTAVESTGKDGTPVKLTLTYLSDNKSGSKNLGSIWLRKSTTVPDAIKAIQNAVTQHFGEASKKTFDIGLIDRRQKSRGHDNGLYLVHLCISGGVMHEKVILETGTIFFRNIFF